MESIKKGLIYVLVANLINLLFNLIISFILPYYLSIDSYATVKTYQLYIGYVGLFHLGFVDGIYLKYGGNDLTEIKTSELLSSLNTLRFFEILVTVVILGCSFLVHARVFFFFALSVMPLNMMSFFKQLYQATGRYSLYGRIINTSTLLVFLTDILLLLFRFRNAYYFLVANFAVYLVVWLVLEIRARSIFEKVVDSCIVSYDILKENIMIGIPLTIGNLSSTLLTSMDRWFVKILMNTQAFAQYSFAVSVEGFLNVAITPFTVTLYNYLCKMKDVHRVRKVRNLIMAFSAFIISGAFPAVYIINHFLVQYNNSSTVLFLLFASQIFFIITKSFYVNMYKATKRQNTYFIKLVFVILFGFIANALLYFASRAMASFAVATMITAIIWLILSALDFKEVVFGVKEMVYPFLVMILFLVCGLLLSPVYGVMIYLTCICFLTRILLRQEFFWMIRMVNNRFLNGVSKK